MPLSKQAHQAVLRECHDLFRAFYAGIIASGGNRIIKFDIFVSHLEKIKPGWSDYVSIVDYEMWLQDELSR